MEPTWRLLLAPLLVVGLALVAAWLHRRRRGMGSGLWQSAQGELVVVDSLTLGQNNRLLVVDWSGQRLLLSCTGQGVTLVDRRVPPAREPLIS